MINQTTMRGIRTRRKLIIFVTSELATSVDTVPRLVRSVPVTVYVAPIDKKANIEAKIGTKSLLNIG